MISNELNQSEALWDIAQNTTLNGLNLQKGLIFYLAGANSYDQTVIKNSLLNAKIALIIDLDQQQNTMICDLAKHLDIAYAHIPINISLKKQDLQNDLILDIDTIKLHQQHKYQDLLFASSYQTHWRRLLQLLAKEQLPLLLFSNADIAKVAIAIFLLQTCLNLPQMLIIDTFMQFNQATHHPINSLMKKAFQQHETLNDIQKLPYLFGTDLSYIDAIFAHISKRYHDPQNFVQNGLKIDITTIEQLKDIYLP
ncbi:MAG: tyrosine-protein phosphatase [Erysipelotrichaceae bacterium]|nr:tyrosine-protein phosphatase [Erysipelotrichaceae bacterium]MDY5252257.1 tyrosine-protein phosphatase [Erysipelotrichaceae bacterium]